MEKTPSETNKQEEKEITSNSPQAAMQPEEPMPTELPQVPAQPQQEPQQEPEQQAPPAPLPDDFEARIAQAETRGYLRGRNERIAELMREPAIFERQTAPAGRSAKDEEWQGESQPMILNNPRVSIWDK